MKLAVPSQMLTLALVLGACQGKVIVARDAPDPCAEVTCASGEACQAGQCVPGQASGACNPLGLGTDCGPNATCIDDVCYTTGNEPPACGPAVNGWCLGGEACVNGYCVTIAPADACSASNPTGLCQGGQRCIEGWCYFDDGLDCSGTRLDGVCPPGDRCNNGICVADAGTCSSTTLNGTCPSWQTCVDGTCMGPLPPDACSPTVLSGRCPAGEVCVQGTCTPIVPNTTCSPSQPAGLCPAGAACVAGTCVDITPANVCSPANTSGLCDAGLTCQAGTCTPIRCENGGMVCDAGEWCTSGVCSLLPCDPVHPQGDCGSSQLVCDRGVCLPPSCSPAAPNGSCPSGLVCTNGSCEAPPPAPCSPSNPTGVCPNPGDVCQGGFCVEGPCSGANLDGTCATTATTCHATLGCTAIPTTCCDAIQQSSTGCTLGTCAGPACSSTQQRGVCPTDEYCNGGTCETAPCGPDFTEGYCTSTVQTCDPFLGCTTIATECCNAADASATGCGVGTCYDPPCSSADPRGVCPPDEYCDGMFCQPAPCGSNFPNGTCSGTDTCVSGVCQPAGCNAQPDPNAFCAPQICIGGSCVTPCSVTAPLGWCPSSVTCVGGACSPPCATDIDCDGVMDGEENIALCATAGDATACAGDPLCLWDGAACWLDTDSDGSPDARDRDSDNDRIPDSIEAGDLNLGTPPLDTDGDGVPNLRDLDSDGDHMSDTYEAGPSPRNPRDSDGDGLRDYVDTDSDADGILDGCEVADGAGGLCSAVGILDLTVGTGAIADSDGDGTPDYRDTDSDSDGILDAIEARARPADPATLSPSGVDHDGDGLPDYRDLDSDDDGVDDTDEDINGDGVVNCQLNGLGAQVPDSRATPACGDTSPPFSVSAPYDYNPGCPSQKCVLSETSRVHLDTDGDGIDDRQDGTFLVCSAANLKPINVFYSQPADFALALETRFDRALMLSRAGNAAGMTFDDSNASGANDGSTAVAGFVLNRVPSAAALAASDPDPARNWIVKALAQETVDRTALATATGVSGVALVIGRNFTSFDGYGVVVSRYRITTSAGTANNVVRDNLIRALDAGLTGYGGTGGPVSSGFTLVTETLYRIDNGTTGTVLVVGALAPTASPFDQSYTYRGECFGAAPPIQNDYIAIGATWSYFQGLSSAPANDGSARTWTDPAYVLTGTWGSGPSGIGFRSAANATQLTLESQSIYVRHTFNLASIPANLSFQIDYNDSYVAYLNGVEVARDPGFVGTPPAHNALADNTHNNGAPVTINLNPATLVVGTNVLAIQVHDRTDQLTCAGGVGPCAADQTNGNGNVVLIPRLYYTTLPAAPCLSGCGGALCTPRADYQIPLFFADNIANGSALAQYGDDVAALCQAMIQSNGVLDFLWTVDNSGSMQQEISQVSTASKLFFQLFNNTEADYRVAQVTSALNGAGAQGWERQFKFDTTVERVNGYLVGDFTGAVAGQIDPLAPDRSVTYTCSEGCFNLASCNADCATIGTQTACEAAPGCDWTGSCVCEPCCPQCVGQAGATVFNDPSCYFASRLPNISGSGNEHSMIAGAWAAYRGGAPVACASITNDLMCAVTSACMWTGSECIPDYCNTPPPGCAAHTGQASCLADTSCNWNATASAACRAAVCAAHDASQTNCTNDGRCMWSTSPARCMSRVIHNAESCNGDDPDPANFTKTFDFPYGADDAEDEYEPPMCEWNAGANAGAGACWPSVQATCSQWRSRGTCTGVCAPLAQTACQADTTCNWNATATAACRSAICAVYDGSQANCNADNQCVWSTTPARCMDRMAAPVNRCAWDSGVGSCVPASRQWSALCAATSAAACTANGWCVWNATASTCSAPPKRAFRDAATKYFVVLTDEEECMFKDTDWNGGCNETSTSGGYAATDPLRLTRGDAVLGYFQARGFSVFGIIGDKGTGCPGAAPVNAVANVAEGTGGGWGSICAPDLYPTIESIVISAVARSSPYKLEGFINGKAVQPVSSTIKVSAELCNVPAEYPFCASGTHVEVVPRSRSNGFDYDAVNNTLILYGSARPVLNGDIVVSYRYWIDNAQPPAGNPSCPCPETSAPGCACPAGLACGIEGATNYCSPNLTQTTCNATPGCAWNTGNGGTCEVTGLCEPDPTCGGGCPTGQVCNPSTGLCECDISCAPGCPVGQLCDSNPMSLTCGRCLCDTTCGGGCPAGSRCNNGSLDPATCGQCLCDPTCGGGCPQGHVCNSDPSSLACGFCQPPSCDPLNPAPGCCPDDDGDEYNVCAGDCIDTWARYCSIYGNLSVCDNAKACQNEQNCLDLGSQNCALVYASCPTDGTAPAGARLGFRPPDINQAISSDSPSGFACGDGIDNDCDGVDAACLP